MKKVKVQRKIGLFSFIVLCLITLAFSAFMFYIIFFDSSSASSKASSHSGDLIFLVVVFIPFLYKALLSKEAYVSDIFLYPDRLVLVYKRQNREIYRRTIFKNKIQDFKVDCNIELKHSGKHSVCDAKCLTTIKVKDDEPAIFSYDSNLTLFGCPYQYILDIIKVSSEIPKFNCNVSGNNDYAKEDIEYFRRHGKRIPFIIQFKKMPLISKIVLAFCFGLMCFCFGTIIFLSLPAPRLSNIEKQYMNHYNLAQEYYSKNEYSSALDELNKAQQLISNQSELYRQKAYIYKAQKEYKKAIKEAKEGLIYVDNTKTAYRRYYNFRLIGKEDISLYSIIAECSRKLKLYDEAIEAYNYIIEHSHYTYDDSHFWRGYCYYYNNQYTPALADFIEHKKVIEKYFKDQSETEYKDLYPRYNEKNMENVEKWIRACS